jgi:hypothetical protein
LGDKGSASAIPAHFEHRRLGTASIIMLMETGHVRFLEKAKNAPYSLFFLRK